MASLTWPIVGKCVLPIFIEKRISTKTRFLEQRCNRSVRPPTALFWLGVHTFVNLASILWPEPLAISTVTNPDLNAALSWLAAFAMGCSLRSAPTGGKLFFPARLPS